MGGRPVPRPRHLTWAAARGGVTAAIAAALSSVDERDAGLASGTNTAAFQIGGGLGAAVVSSVVVSQAKKSSLPAVLTKGFQAGFTTCVVFAVIGLCVTLVLLRPPGHHTRSET